MAESVRDQYRIVNGRQMHYREWGDKKMPTLVILHGLTGHAWEFDGIASALADKFHVLILDQRGHGDSGWADDYSPALMADDIADFADMLHLESFSIVGHSMGGVNGWWFASLNCERVRRLVIIDVDPLLITSREVIRGLTEMLDDYSKDRFSSPEAAVDCYFSRYGVDKHGEELRSFVLNNIKHKCGCWEWKFDTKRLAKWVQAAAASEEMHWLLLGKITCPTLIVRAKNSPFTSYHSFLRFKKRVPGSRLSEIPDSGHDIHIDNEYRLIRELRNFLIN